VINIRTGAISTLDLAGITGHPTRHFSVSRDESKLMVVSSENGTDRLWLKVLGKNEAKVISETFPPIGMPDWFPDDLGYAFSADDNGSFQIYVSSLGRSDARQITFSNFSASYPAVAPDGRKIAYVTNIDQADIFQIDIATEKQTRLTNNVNMQLFPALSPGGEHLAYQSISESSKLTSGILRVDRIEAQGARPNVTLSQAGCCIKWAPNGQEVAFVRRVGTNFGIFSIALGSLAETALVPDGIAFPAFSIAPFDLAASPFAWTPDGSAVTYVSNISGNLNVWTVARDGSHPAMVTEFRDDTITPVSPIWAPDGARIAFVETITPGSARRRTENRIAVSEHGTKRIIAAFESPITLVGWSKTGDGVFVAVSAPGHEDVLFVPADGPRNSRRVARLRDARSLGIRISPDQRWIAYGVIRNNLNDLCITPTTGGSERCITSNDDSTLFYSGLSWTSDSKALLYSKQTGGMQISLISQPRGE
jgi:Tol biopolymer transport system component